MCEQAPSAWHLSDAKTVLPVQKFTPVVQAMIWRDYECDLKKKAPVGSTRPGDLVEIEKLAASSSSVQPLPGVIHSL